MINFSATRGLRCFAVAARRRVACDPATMSQMFASGKCLRWMFDDGFAGVDSLEWICWSGFTGVDLLTGVTRADLLEWIYRHGLDGVDLLEWIRICRSGFAGE